MQEAVSGNTAVKGVGCCVKPVELSIVDDFKDLIRTTIIQSNQLRTTVGAYEYLREESAI